MSDDPSKPASGGVPAFPAPTRSLLPKPAAAPDAVPAPVAGPTSVPVPAPAPVAAPVAAPAPIAPPAPEPEPVVPATPIVVAPAPRPEPVAPAAPVVVTPAPEPERVAPVVVPARDRATPVYVFPIGTPPHTAAASPDDARRFHGIEDTVPADASAGGRAPLFVEPLPPLDAESHAATPDELRGLDDLDDLADIPTRADTPVARADAESRDVPPLGSAETPLTVVVHAVESAVTRRVSILLAVVSLMMVLFHMQLSSRENANTGSRYATIEALVDYHTYDIDKTHYTFTPDKVKARDHFVSSKPPLLPTYGAGVYWVLKKLTAYNIADNEGVVVWTVGVFTGWLGHLVFLIYFYRFCRLLLARQLAILGAVAAACFAYLGVAYGTAINNHSPGATLAMVGFYHAYRARNEGSVLRFAYAGIWLGILPAIDLSSAALTAFTALYLASRDWKRTLLVYVPLTLPGMVAQVLLAHHATGSWIPAYADTGLMKYSGSYFGGHRSGIDALFEPKPTYAFHVLLGHHGLFSMTPIFFFSLYELVRRLVRRDRFFAECAVFTATIVVVCAFYIFRTHNYGGWCVGMRWLVPVMPWLVVAFGLFLERAVVGSVTWAFIALAFAVSAFNVQDGLTSPFQFSLWHNFLDGEPNRNRLGPKWNLSRPTGPPRERKPKAPPRPPPARPTPANPRP